jgi:hypothetical protein
MKGRTIMALQAKARFGGALVAGVLSLALARPASADPRACIHAHSTGQREAKAGHLRLASQLFTSCGSDDSCPDQLRKECADFLQDVTRTIPTVVLSALDENGHDVAAAKVYSGDDVIADGLDGRAVEIDPGRYHLRFVLADGEELATDVVVREGEKQRLVQVKKDRPVVSERPGGAESRPEGSDGPRHLGVAPWVAAGVTVAALGTGVTLGLLGSAKKSDLDACKPGCPSTDRSTYDATRTLFLGADIGFAAAVVGSVVTTWLFLSGGSSTSRDAAPDPKATSTSRGVWLSGTPLPGGGAVGMAGQF